MFNQGCTPMGFVSLVVGGTAAAGLTASIVTGTTALTTIPPGANLALLAVQTGACTYRDDGTAPTPTSGVLMQVSSPPLEYSGDLKAIQFIGVTGTVSVAAVLYRTAG